MSAIVFKQHDSSQGVQERLEIGGEPVRLTSATVVFVLRHVESGVTRRLPAVVVDGSVGLVRWVPEIGDLDLAGDYEFEWEVTQSLVVNGVLRPSVETFPNDSYGKLRVMEDLG